MEDALRVDFCWWQTGIWEREKLEMVDRKEKEFSGGAANEKSVALKPGGGCVSRSYVGPLHDVPSFHAQLSKPATETTLSHQARL